MSLNWMQSAAGAGEVLGRDPAGQEHSRGQRSEHAPEGGRQGRSSRSPEAACRGRCRAPRPFGSDLGDSACGGCWIRLLFLFITISDSNAKCHFAARTHCLLRTVLWRPQHINNPLDISLELPSKATDHNGSDETAELKPGGIIAKC